MSTRPPALLTCRIPPFNKVHVPSAIVIAILVLTCFSIAGRTRPIGQADRASAASVNPGDWFSDCIGAAYVCVVVGAPRSNSTIIDVSTSHRKIGLPLPYHLLNPAKVCHEPVDPSGDCILLDVIDAPPISFAYPLPSATPEVGDTTIEGPVVSRKRSGAGTAESGPSQPAAKNKKLVKKAVVRPQKPRMEG